MMKYVLMIVVAAVMAATGAAGAMMATDTHIAVQNLGAEGGNPLLDKTWTKGVQENEAGSQVLISHVLTSPVSFQAEGKGFEPSTGCPAPDFETAGRFP